MCLKFGGTVRCVATLDTSWYLSIDGRGVCSLRSCSRRSLTLLDEGAAVLVLCADAAEDAWLLEYCFVRLGACFFGIEPI